MLASIIIPAFEARETAPLAIMTALRQTWADLEVIVVDDASSDGTANAAQDAANGDPRFRLLRLETNRGVSGARNAGLQAARGDWVAFLDADDSFETERLSKLIPEARSSAADLLADNLYVSWANRSYPDHLAFPESRMAQRKPVSASSFAASDRPRWGLRAAGYMKPIFRRDFLLKQGLQFPEGLRCSEDFHFFMQCLLRGGILRYSKYAGYRYTVRAGSLSASSVKAIRSDHVASNRSLLQEAINRHDDRAAAELRRRENDLQLWYECIEIRDALRHGRLNAAASTFWQMSSKTYAIARLSEKVGKEAASRLGRSQY